MDPRDLLPPLRRSARGWSGPQPWYAVDARSAAALRRRAAAAALLAVAAAHLAPSGATPAPAAAAVAAPARPAPAPLDDARFAAVLTSYGLEPEGRSTRAQRAGLSAVLAHFPRAQRRDAVRVAWCESRLDPAAVGRNRDGTSDVGLFQFNDGGTLQHYVGSTARALDPDASARAARAYVRERGWRPWTCGEIVGAV
ncbi:transglycosylase SLT domain-containing protein [Vallicoccus soli]|uniref:Transglycosylase SLT domain-containing protein n=1 Tax=Vallicoccus soli TaxID=2339232 RepID=A0A3A3ZMR9_9ACTN|nr:transglycosylase SLT domain-containing protein [Vallicoccus soli]RJK98015.1 hypothetical protein D5H78_03410 [Vallicoccus soli]